MKPRPWARCSPARTARPGCTCTRPWGAAGDVRAGCVRPGLDVWKIFEVVLIEITGTDLTRARDPETGFELLGRAAG